MTARSVLAAAAGAVTGVAALAAIRLDVAFVSAYRRDRTWPYRALMALFAFLCCLAIARARGDRGRTRSLARTALLGAASGYAAGVVAWFVMTAAFSSPAAAASALAEAPGGIVPPLAVALIASSWLTGAIAAVVTQVLATERGPAAPPAPRVHPRRASRPVVLRRAAELAAGALPVGPFAAMLPAFDGADRRTVAAALPRLAASGCVELCCVGPESERLHDDLDEELVAADRADVVTTWHVDPFDACEHFVLAAAPGVATLVAYVADRVDLAAELGRAMDRA